MRLSNGESTAFTMEELRPAVVMSAAASEVATPTKNAKEVATDSVSDSGDEADAAPMEKALGLDVRSPATGSAAGKAKTVTVATAAEALSSAMTLLDKFKSQVTELDLDASVAKSKKSQRDATAQSFEDLLLAKQRELEVFSGKERKKKHLVQAAALNNKAATLQGAKLIFNKARAMYARASVANKRGLIKAVHEASAKFDVGVGDLRFVIKHLLAKAELGEARLQDVAKGTSCKLYSFCR